VYVKVYWCMGRYKSVHMQLKFPFLVHTSIHEKGVIAKTLHQLHGTSATVTMAESAGVINAARNTGESTGVVNAAQNNGETAGVVNAAQNSGETTGVVNAAQRKGASSTDRYFLLSIYYVPFFYSLIICEPQNMTLIEIL
jgi:hypothetical protein